MISYQKTKSVAKVVHVRSELEKIVLPTMKLIADLVGATLGPGGHPVLIERYEHDLPPMITKDGVTVFKSIGLKDPTAQCVMEAARDAASRTANEAGDGTTTATVLAEAIVRMTHEYCVAHPTESPQKAVRLMERAFSEVIEPGLREASLRPSLEGEEGEVVGEGERSKGWKLLRSVAKVSANGEGALADAVMDCFDLTGDAGNVTIAEMSGTSRYEVEAVQGYPIATGYEDCCGVFYPKFVNRQDRQTCYMESPVFLLYHGKVNDVQTLYRALGLVAEEFDRKIQGQPALDDNGQPREPYKHHNVVVVATGFSEQVLGTIAAMFPLENAINVFPLVVPLSPAANGQKQFIDDLAAVTGAKVFDPLNKPLDSATLEDFGPSVWQVEVDKSGEEVLAPGWFEAGRYKATVYGRAEEDAIIARVADLEVLSKNSEGGWDKQNLEERIGKLTGGIARLKVFGTSTGELKEKAARADDAVCAVRGALRHGCLPGGGWGLLLTIMNLARSEEFGSEPVIQEILIPALTEPIKRLLTNCGMNDEEIGRAVEPVNQSLDEGKTIIYDALRHQHGDAFELGVLDSTPAVLEAIRSSLSIASLLGTLGGTVVFGRDRDLELSEARDTEDWNRKAHINEANIRW